ncbi:MAG: PQQ-dependent sugar dehydrogenase [Planctomycetota bacterium]|nr:PQQ-dependent sugar dehydrogenase [Planctomycetota bacterium]
MRFSPLQRAALFSIAVLLLTGSTAWAQPPLKLQPVVTTGLTNPIYATPAPGVPNKLFVAERGGAIKIVDLSSSAVTGTFMTLSPAPTTVGERGLLGLAFDPNYVNNGRFYTFSTGPTGSNEGDLLINRYQANISGGNYLNSTTASNTATNLLTLDRPNTSLDNHNGGWIGFKPGTSHLYIGTGDGGGGNDDLQQSQNINSPHGKMLRIDVNGNNAPGGNYGIPAGNPFAGATPGVDEIWSIGLRNPFRNSFDRQTGDLWIGDVGQNAKEEIDFQASNAASLINYGWSFREGTVAGPKAPPGTILGTVVDPVHEYDSGAGSHSITGGYMYRGAIPGLDGTYFYGDYITGQVGSFRYDGATKTDIVDRTAQLDPPGSLSNAFNLASFAEDNNGELYMVLLGAGDIYRIIPELEGDLDSDGFVGQDDLNLILSNWGQTVPPGNVLADYDGSGSVGQDDLNAVLSSWGQGIPPGVEAVPEPSSVLLFGFAGVGLAAFAYSQVGRTAGVLRTARRGI